MLRLSIGFFVLALLSAFIAYISIATEVITIATIFCYIFVVMFAATFVIGGYAFRKKKKEENDRDDMTALGSKKL